MLLDMRDGQTHHQTSSEAMGPLAALAESYITSRMRKDGPSKVLMGCEGSKLGH